MNDEQSRGLHLTDKHIVFAVMAATVVAVVAFLCGVFVGRGVLAARPSGPEPATLEGRVAPDVEAPATDVDAGAYGEGGNSAAAPPPEPVKYPDRLFTKEAPAETLKELPPSSSLPAPPPEAPADSAGPPATPPANRAAEEPGAGNYTVQVAAVRQKAEAQRIVDRLKRRGFPAYVFVPSPGDRGDGFRVRVGSYKSRQEADTMAARLQKEEKYKTWITRSP
jgi:cell division septation protein DedD